MNCLFSENQGSATNILYCSNVTLEKSAEYVINDGTPHFSQCARPKVLNDTNLKVKMDLEIPKYLSDSYTQGNIPLLQQRKSISLLGISNEPSDHLPAMLEGQNLEARSIRWHALHMVVALEALMSHSISPFSHHILFRWRNQG